MTLFKKAEMQTAYLKMGVYGEAGSGKSHTASLVASGLALYIESAGYAKPPVLFFDTETGSDWVKPIFDGDGVEMQVAKTRAFEDLKTAVREAEASGAILIVDSITHVWEEVREAFLERKRQNLKKPHARLELPDWNVIKPEWGKFTSLYLNSCCHIVLCGRAANVYEFQEREDSPRKEMITAGTRMASEKGLGYEPSLLVEMTSHQITEPGRRKTVIRKATVLKDRSTTIDGEQFENPGFFNFLPHVKRLNLGGRHAGFDASRTSIGLFPKEERDRSRIDREIIVEEIHELLAMHGMGGTSGEAQMKRAKTMAAHFGTTSKTEIEKVMPLHELRERYNSLHIALEQRPSRYFLAEPEEVDDAIPDAPAKPEANPASAAKREEIIGAMAKAAEQKKDKAKRIAGIKRVASDKAITDLAPSDREAVKSLRSKLIASLAATPEAVA